MDERILSIIGRNLVNVIQAAIQSGKSRQEAEREAARAVERGEIVSDELYDRLDNYIRETKKFEDGE